VKHRSLGGRPIDILAADACLMQMLEVANELSDQAEYIVGSAHLQNPFGLPYRTLFHDLNTFPLSEPLGDLELRTLHLGADQAFAAIDMMSAVDGLVSRLDLGNKLKAYIGFQREESERLLQKAAAHRAADFIEDFRGELFPPNPSLEATAKLALRIKLELLDESDFSRLKQYQFAAFRMIDQWVIQTEPVNLKEIQNSLIEAIHRLSVERIPKPRRKKVQEVVKKILEHQRRSLVNGLQSQLVPDAKNDFTMAALSGSSLEFQVVGAMVAFSEAMKEFLFLGGNERRDDIRKVILKTPGFVGGSKDIHVFLAYLEEYIQVYLAGLRPLNPTETKLLNGTRAFMAALSGQDGWNQGAVTGYVQGQNFFWHHYRKNLGDRAFELAEKHFRAVSVWLPESPAELMARWADMNQSQFFQYGKSTEFEEGAWPVWLKLVYLPYSLCEELEEIVYRDFLDQNKPQPAAADLAKWIHHNYGKQYSESHISFCLKYLQMDL
jgi:hypothetical protein